MVQNGAKDNPKHDRDEERSAEDKPARRRVRRILVQIGCNDILHDTDR